MQEPRRYLQRPIVTAMQWTGDNETAIEEWIRKSGHPTSSAYDPTEGFSIRTVLGWRMANHGDWIILNWAGDWMVANNEDFQKAHSDIEAIRTQPHGPVGP